MFKDGSGEALAFESTSAVLDLLIVVVDHRILALLQDVSDFRVQGPGLSKFPGGTTLGADDCGVA